jgi:hypothetical protein
MRQREGSAVRGLREDKRGGVIVAGVECKPEGKVGSRQCSPIGPQWSAAL